MEEKKRKKSKKKKWSAKSQSALSHPEASEAPNSSSPDHPQCSNRNVDIQTNPCSFANGHSRGKVEASVGVMVADEGTDRTATCPEQTQIFVSEESSSCPASDPRVNADGNLQQETRSEDGPEFPIQKRNFENIARDSIGKMPDRVCEQTQTETDLHDEEARLREELTAKVQLVDELREALATTTENAETLHAVLDELRTAHDIFETSAHQQIQQLRAEILQLREAETDHLKLEAAKHVETQQLEEENVHLRGESIRLSKEVEEMRDLIERLMLECQRLSAKMMQIQAGTHQRESVAAAHACFEDDVANVQWVTIEDPVAEARAAAEESHRQLAAAASMVERLVTENSELGEKVNEQNALIDRLALKYSSVMELQSNGLMEKSVSEKNDVLTFANKDVVDIENSGTQALYEVLSPGCSVVSSPDEKDIETQRTVIPSLVSMVSTSIAVLPVGIDRLSQEMCEEIISDAINGIESPENLQEGALMKPNELKPFSDAPILGAPIRFFNFIAKYVSGADLVKAEEVH